MTAARDRGICPSCGHSNECHLRAHATAPVNDCDEYEPGGTAGDSAAVLDDVGDSATGTGAEASSRLGLCANCSRRAKCTYVRPEGGVWHCEDYA